MSLRKRLTSPEILLAPGVYDGLTAALATDAGFEALYLSGAAVAYTRLGRPDIGLTTASEMADTMALIADRTDLPVIMDADTGQGDDTLALVFNDSTSSTNGLYVSASGVWSATTLQLASASVRGIVGCRAIRSKTDNRAVKY